MNSFTSKVNGIAFPYGLSDNHTYAKVNGLKGISWLKFWTKVGLGFLGAERRLARTLRTKTCYYGPFKGEFGHFLAHTLPFLMYLHSKGVKIKYCGMELHRPFLVDESGRSIVTEFITLRDFFGEVPPSSNSVVPPMDVQQVISKWTNEAENSGLPFWNIGDDFYYWFVHRNWLGRGYTRVYNLAKVYKTADERAVCLFPRSKGAASSHNNGEPWDYQNLVNLIKPHFDKVYVVGHPSQSISVAPSDKVEIRITSDNAQILEACSNSRLIVTQHSGVNNLGEYLHRQVLIIYKGGSKISDIGSMNNTMRFRQFMNERLPLNFAFSEAQVVDYVRTFESK